MAGVSPLTSGQPGPTNVAALKERVRGGLPRIEATVRAWQDGAPDAPASWKGTFSHGDTAWARNSLYTSMAWQLEPNRGRYWFAAAGMVTGRGGIKSLEGVVPSFIGDIPPLATRLHVPEPADLEMIIKGNAFLFRYNLHNWYRLREKPLHAQGSIYPLRIAGLDGLWGGDLDRGLVVLEQTLVQKWLDSYPWASTQARTASVLRVSKGFNSKFANEWLKSILIALFGTDGFDFGNIDHRIELGLAFVARLRDQGG